MPKSTLTTPINNGAFSFGSHGFNIDGISRVGGPSLHEMLFPNECNGKRAQKRARDRANTTITFRWLVAQLIFYDIEMVPDFTVAALTELLAKNVKHGKCNKLPSRVRAIAAELEQLFQTANSGDPDFEPNKEKPPQKPDAHRVERLNLAEKHEQTVKKFKTAVDLANYDCNLFLAKYFLDQNGNPDPSRAPFPVILPGISDRLALQQAADTIPDLKVLSGGEGNLQILVIGWNRVAIFETAEKISADQARLRGAMSPTWQRHMQAHYSVVQRLPVSSELRPLQIESARGEYAVECREVMHNHGGLDGDDSSLKIFYRNTVGWVGHLKLGIIYGVMGLHIDRKALLARCKAREKNKSREDDHGGGMDTTLEELETIDVEADANEEEDVSSNLSALEPTEFKEAALGIDRKRKQAFTKAPKSPAKRAKLPSSTSSNRLYFEWRGLEGDIVCSPYKDNVGYLQFADATCTRFESTISSPMVGKNVRFRGFKISTDGNTVTGR